jgi:hypothetical protein
MDHPVKPGDDDFVWNGLTLLRLQLQRGGIDA